MNIFYQIMSWSARAISIFVLGFVVLAGFTDIPDPMKFTNSEILLFVPLLVILGGLVLSWFKPMSGGALVFITSFMFMIIAQNANEFTYLMSLSGLLFLFSGIISKVINEEQRANARDI